MNVMITIEEEVEYCFYVMNNAKTRGNNSCQVPIFANPETIQSDNLPCRYKAIPP